MIKKLIYGLIFAIVITLGTAHGASTDKTINDLTAETAPATGDLVVIWDVSAAKNRKMTLENLIGEAGVSLYVLVLDTPSLHSSGSGVTVKVSYDLFVDTNTLFVDASTNRVCIGCTDPLRNLDVRGTDPVIALYDTSASGVSWQLTSGFNANDEFAILNGKTGLYPLAIDSSGVVTLGTSGTSLFFGSGDASIAESSGGEMTATNDAGQTTQLTSHDPNSGKWVHNSHNSITGETERGEIEGLFKAFEVMADLVAILAADKPAIAAQAQAIADKVFFSRTTSTLSQGQLKQILNDRKAKARARWKKQWKDKNKTVMISVEEIIDPISGVTSLKRNRIAIYPPDSEAEAAAVAQFRHIIPKYMKDMAGLP